MTTIPADYSIAEAVQHLSAADPSMGALIHAVGLCEGVRRPAEHPFEALTEAVVYQQLSGKAAATILGRFRALCGSPDRLDPAVVLELEPDAMRAAGLSRAKTAAILDLAEKSLSGVVPHQEELAGLDDEAIIERLTVVRGIGPWSVQMFLMFRLGRPDVLPHTDLGIRKGVQRLDGLQDVPAPAAVVHRGEVWRPFRTLASWYLWRSLELDSWTP
jgi:DNA-3-methyladenine glycosylase II